MLKITQFSEVLVDSLVAALKKEFARDLSKVCLVFPTDRMGQYFMALYAESTGAFLAPQIKSWQSFLSDHCLAALPSPKASLSLSDAATEIVIRSLLDREKFIHLRPGMEHELAQLINDTFALGWDPDQLNHALSMAVSQDTLADERTLVYFEERFHEIKSLLKSLGSLGEEKGLIFSRYAAYQDLKEFCEKDCVPKLDPGVRYLIAGLTTLAPVHQRVLSQIAHDENVTIWLTEAPTLPALRFNPLADIMGAFEGASSAQKGLNLQGQNHDQEFKNFDENIPESRHVIVTCASPVDEVARMTDLVQTLLTEGVCPSQIGIIIPSEKNYRHLIKEVFERSTIPYNFALAMPFMQTSLGSFIASFIALVQNPCDPHYIGSFLCHPLTAKAWTKDLETPSPSTLWTDYLKAMEFRNFFLKFDSAATSRVERGAGEKDPGLFSLCCFIQEHVKKHKTLPLSQWLSLAEEVFLKTFDPWVDSSGDEKDRERELAAHETLSNLFKELGDLAQVLTMELSVGSFFKVLSDHVETLEIREKGYAFSGVQILGLDEARHIPFAYGIFLGLVEGILPKGLPSDVLIDDVTKYKAGLRGWSYIEAIEETTLRLIFSQCRQTFFFYPQQMGGTEVARSRYLEQLLILNSATELSQNAFEALILACSSNQSQAASINNVHPGEKTEDLAGPKPQSGSLLYSPTNAYRPEYEGYFRDMRVTQIGRLIDCPFAFLLSAMGVSEFTLPSKDDPRILGIWLHKVLEKFGEAMATQQKKGQHSHIPASVCSLPLNTEQSSLSRYLQELSEKYRPQEFDDSWTIQHLRLFSWPKIASFINQLGEFIGSSKFADVWVERSILGEGIPLSLGDSSYLGPKPRGKIDAVYLGEKDAFILDFKRISLPSQKDILLGLEPQLFIYYQALGKELVPKENIYLLYFSIYAGEAKLVGMSSRGKDDPKKQEKFSRFPGKSPGNTADTDLITSRIMDLLTFRFREDTGAETPLIVPDISRCQFCSYTGICGKNDPRYKDAFTKEKRLLKKIDQSAQTDKRGEADG